MYRRAIVGIYVVLWAAQAGPVGAGSASPVAAEIAGKPIAARDVLRYHCHDLHFPIVRCFRSSTARDEDAGLAAQPVAPITRSIASDPQVASVASVFYVTFFEHSNFLGASYAASQPIANLGLFGWNDAISSFKSLNGQRPKFWRDNDYLGTSWQWPASYWVSYVGNGANDQFSSVKNVL